MASLDGLRWPCAAPSERFEHGLVAGPGAHPAPNQSILVGQLAAAQGDCETALRQWQLTSDRNDPRSRLAHFEMGRGLYSLGDLPAAIEQFRFADSGQTIHDLALSRRQANRDAEAQTLFELAFGVKPNVLTADQLVQIYVEAGQGERAVKVWPVSYKHLTLPTTI